MSNTSINVLDSDLARDIAVPAWSFRALKNVPVGSLRQDSDEAVNFIASLAASVRNIASHDNPYHPIVFSNDSLMWEYADDCVSVRYSTSRNWDYDDEAKKTPERYSIGVNNLLWAKIIGHDGSTLVGCDGCYGEYHDVFSMSAVDRDIDHATLDAFALDESWITHLAHLPGTEEDLVYLVDEVGLDMSYVVNIEKDEELAAEDERFLKVLTVGGNPKVVRDFIALASDDPGATDAALDDMDGDSGVILEFACRETRDLAKSVLVGLGASVEGCERGAGPVMARTTDARMPVAKRPTRFSITVTDPGEHKASVINALRDTTGIDILEAFDIVDSCPSVVAECDQQDVAPIMKRLAEAGASLTIKMIS